MDYETAKEIVHNALAFFDPTNLIFQSINRIEDEEIRNEFKADAELVMKHSTALLLKAVKRYPDLSPFK
jgi:hypothetical protein